MLHTQYTKCYNTCDLFVWRHNDLITGILYYWLEYKNLNPSVENVSFNYYIILELKLLLTILTMKLWL